MPISCTNCDIGHFNMFVSLAYCHQIIGTRVSRSLYCKFSQILHTRLYLCSGKSLALCASKRYWRGSFTFGCLTRKLSIMQFAQPNYLKFILLRVSRLRDYVGRRRYTYSSRLRLLSLKQFRETLTERELTIDGILYILRSRMLRYERRTTEIRLARSSRKSNYVFYARHASSSCASMKRTSGEILPTRNGKRKKTFVTLRNLFVWRSLSPFDTGTRSKSTEQPLLLIFNILWWKRI